MRSVSRWSALFAGVIVVVAVVGLLVGATRGTSKSSEASSRQLQELPSTLDEDTGSPQLREEAEGSFWVDSDEALNALDLASKSLPPQLQDLEGLGEVKLSSSTDELSEAAIALLKDYRAARNCVLVQAGWLDLLGSVWGCVIQGDAWVDVCVVKEGSNGGSELTTIRMHEEEVAKALADEPRS